MNKDYYQKERKKILRQRKHWRNNNKDKVKEAKHRYYLKHKKQINEHNKVYCKVNKKKVNKRMRKWYHKNKQEQRKKHREWYAKNIDKIKGYYSKYRIQKLAQGRIYHLKHKEHRNRMCRKYYREKNAKWMKIYNQQIRQRVIAHYGQKCRCCGETEYLFLTLHHKNGGGNKHRKKVGRSGTEFYKWVLKHNFPKDLEVLCYNCNCAKGHHGICPHKRQKQMLEGTNKLKISMLEQAKEGTT